MHSSTRASKRTVRMHQTRQYPDHDLAPDSIIISGHNIALNEHTLFIYYIT